MGIIKKELQTTSEKFFQAVKIYCREPKSINKEVLYSDVLLSLTTQKLLSDDECQSLYNAVYTELISNKSNLEDVESGLQNKFGLERIDKDILYQETNGSVIIIRKIVPKKIIYVNNDFYDIFIISTQLNSLRLYSVFENPTEENCDPLVIMKFNKLNVYYNNCLFVEFDDDLGYRGNNWINSIFVNKFVKLITSEKKENDLHFSNLVNVVNYYKLYERLKSKYAKNLIENWTENTDPQKFVFEDIGIATYLLLLWNNGEIPTETARVQKFMDLGCGNGLLVYILNSEGHNGIGLDLRRRKIWDTYPPNIILREETVIPGEGSYPDADWLIGNHSDELTPWLPIMARRSGPQCQYFTLPCCAFHLNGTVYQRKNSGLSVYHDHIQNVKELSELCGFETHIDRLRIPSTKRICLVGRKHVISPINYKILLSEIDLLIEREGCDFKPRVAVEKVRNCTRLPKDIINGVIQNISKRLLQDVDYTNLNDKKWNRGGSLNLSDLANVLTAEQLKCLKNECKGLQTLIKNHHHVFKVSGGVVRLRNADEMLELSKNVVRDDRKWKKKECWFYYNHPDGCPLLDNNCSYKHS